MGLPRPPLRRPDGPAGGASWERWTPWASSASSSPASGRTTASPPRPPRRTCAAATRPWPAGPSATLTASSPTASSAAPTLTKPCASWRTASPSALPGPQALRLPLRRPAGGAGGGPRGGIGPPHPAARRAPHPGPAGPVRLGRAGGGPPRPAPPPRPPILAHIGGGGDWAFSLKAVRDCPNVYLDLSGAWTPAWWRPPTPPPAPGASSSAPTSPCARAWASCGGGDPRGRPARHLGANLICLLDRPGPAPQRPSGPRPMILDANCAIGHWPFRPLWTTTAEGLLRMLDRAGIERAIVSHTHAVFYRSPHQSNAELYHALRPHRDRLIPFACLTPDYAGWRDDLKQCVEEWDFRGCASTPATTATTWPATPSRSSWPRRSATASRLGRLRLRGPRQRHPGHRAGRERAPHRPRRAFPGCASCAPTPPTVADMVVRHVPHQDNVSFDTSAFGGPSRTPSAPSSSTWGQGACCWAPTPPSSTPRWGCCGCRPWTPRTLPAPPSWARTPRFLER